MGLTLYSSVYCPYAWCARALLHEKGADYEAVEVDLKAQPADGGPPEAGGRLPVSVDDDDVLICETIVINEYIEDLYPLPNLMGATPAERALVRTALIDLNVWRTQPLAKLAAMLYFKRSDRDQDQVDRQLLRWGTYLDELEEHFRSADWMAIDRFSVADINAYTTVAVSRGLGAEVNRNRPHLREWLGRMDARECISESAPLRMTAVA